MLLCTFAGKQQISTMKTRLSFKKLLVAGRRYRVDLHEHLFNTSLARLFKRQTISKGLVGVVQIFLAVILIGATKDCCFHFLFMLRA